MRCAAVLLIYGATGYTGRLIAAHAQKVQRSIIVAGRTMDHVGALATELGVTGRVFALDDPATVDDALADVGVVINAASPFAETMPPLIEACLRARSHYLDVSGELPVFRQVARHDSAARRRGIMMMPGAGLGVVASDCLAMHVAALVPKAKYLRIALLRPNSFSRGTFRSALGLAGSRVDIRRNGQLISVPVGQLQRRFDYGDGERESVAVSWADVLTAHYSTGISNIEAYFEADFASRALYHLGAGIADAMRFPPVQRWLGRAARAWPEGPSVARRQMERSVIVAEAEDSWRQCRRVRLETKDGYSFTAEAATAIAQRALRGEFLPGFQTPAKVHGADFVLGFSRTRRDELRLPFSPRQGR